MKNRLLLLALIVVLPSGIACAEFPSARPYKSLLYKHESRRDPAQQIYVAAVDLTDPNVQVRVSRGGSDPDGEGKWQTTLMQPTRIAEREGFDVVINGDFFQHLSGKDAEGAAALKEFKSGIPALAVGPAETDRNVWAVPEKSRAAFFLDDRKGPHIAVMKVPPADAMQVVAGSDVLVRGGQNVAPPPEKGAFAKGPHPRTAVGYRDGGKTLLLVVVDGRQKGKAVGMSLKDLADVMIKYGAEAAVNLDGGGSSVLAIRNPQTHKMEIMNKPSDGRERVVANVLGVRLTGAEAGDAAKRIVAREAGLAAAPTRAR